MKFRISNRSEKLVGRLDAGDDLVDALTKACEDHGVRAGEVRAVGHFDAVELVHFNQKSQSYQPLIEGEGSFELVSLNGNISTLGGAVALRLDAVFNVVGPLGPQMVGGQLRKARAIDGEFVIESYLDLEMERRLDGETGRLVLDEIRRRPGAPTPESSAPARSGEAVEEDDEEPSISWDQAIAEAEQVEQSRRSARRPSAKTTPLRPSAKSKDDPYGDLDLDAPLMSAGDLLDHPKLGRCRVIDVEDDQFARIRLPRGRIRKLALEIIDVEYQGKEEGKNLFIARVRR